MKNKIKPIKKVLKSICYTCEGLGIIEPKQVETALIIGMGFIGWGKLYNSKNQKQIILRFVKKYYPQYLCRTCNGTGIYKENHYIISDGKNAIDKDTLE